MFLIILFKVEGCLQLIQIFVSSFPVCLSAAGSQSAGNFFPTHAPAGEDYHNLIQKALCEHSHEGLEHFNVGRS